MAIELPRGVRLCNPGNIRKSSTLWLGLSDTQSDPDFFTFSNAKYGIRAIAVILKTYQREGISTIRDAIDRWAPPVENNTSAYVSDVCEQCSVDPDKPIDFKLIMVTLVKAIIRHENGLNNGQPWYDDMTVGYGVSLA